jgi:nucleoside-diphosphate-sugar epimerase
VNILITGATGFIGGDIAMHLARNADFKIVATGRSATERFQAPENVEFIRADLLRNVPEGKFDTCIHCAGLADDRAGEEEFLLQNVEVTRLLIKSLRGCNNFIFISSSSVYNFSDGNVKSEIDTAVNPGLSFYGKSKLLAEEIVKLSGINSVYILRPRAVYGTNDRLLMPRILRLLKGRFFVIPGDLNVKASLTHIDNLTEAVEQAVSAAKPGLHIYNIADRRSYVLRDIFRQIGYKKISRPVRFLEIPVAVINMVLFAQKSFGFKSQINRQAIDYLTYDSVIDPGSSVSELGIECKFDFYNDFITKPVRP